MRSIDQLAKACAPEPDPAQAAPEQSIVLDEKMINSIAERVVEILSSTTPSPENPEEGAGEDKEEGGSSEDES